MLLTDKLVPTTDNQSHSTVTDSQGSLTPAQEATPGGRPRLLPRVECCTDTPEPTRKALTMSLRGALLSSDACIKSCCMQWTQPALHDPQLMLTCVRSLMVSYTHQLLWIQNPCQPPASHQFLRDFHRVPLSMHFSSVACCPVAATSPSAPTASSHTDLYSRALWDTTASACGPEGMVPCNRHHVLVRCSPGHRGTSPPS